MDIRAQVWSPVQNTAVWLAAWLYGYESSDATIAALQHLGGRNTVEGTPVIELLSGLRSATSTILSEPEPALRLVLVGPNDPPALPAGSRSERALHFVTSNDDGATQSRPATVSGYTFTATLIVRDNEPGLHHVLIPQYSHGATEWTWVREDQALPEYLGLTAGDADYYLTQATTAIAELVKYSEHIPDDVGHRLPTEYLGQGKIFDAYEVSGLPESVPAKAAEIFARADRLADATEFIAATVNDDSLDSDLHGLFQHLRHARMAGVHTAVVEFARSTNTN